ncbi:hypothetical protein G6F56_006390 [Rhizopus delemar]|nr:hypothetical protein G6F56_006390 [Rhizopus delemar]
MDNTLKLKIRRTIYNTFTKKYGLHLQSNAAEFLQQTLANEGDLSGTLEMIVKTYKKRNTGEKSIIVDEATIKEVITSMKTSALMARSLTPFQREENSDGDISDSMDNMMIRDSSTISLPTSMSSQTLEETVNVEQHFHVVDAFQLPKLEYDDFTRTFNQSKTHSSLLASPQETANAIKVRYAITKQRILRNEAFGPSSLSTGDSSAHIKITSIKNLAGEDGKQFTLFGMLERLADGKLHLEDMDAVIELDISQSTYDYGLFTSGMLVIVEGIFGKDHIFHVSEINLPPAEARNMTDAVVNDVDFFGLPKSLVDEGLLKIEEKRHEEIFFLVLSDVHLDQIKVLDALKVIFNEYQEEIPLAVILMGNFSSKPVKDLARYKDGFNALADIIGAHNNMALHTNFVLVPGPEDPWGEHVLPRFSLPPHFLTRLKQKASNVHCSTNPCRIRYCTQDIVIFRENILDKYLKNLLLPVNLQVEHQHIKHLVRTILDQGHLLPLLKQSSYKNFEHAQMLFPLPHTLIIADKTQNYRLDYEGTHCINPGSFTNSGMTWSIYYPSTKTTTKCSLSGHQ